MGQQQSSTANVSKDVHPQDLLMMRQLVLESQIISGDVSCADDLGSAIGSEDGRKMDPQSILNSVDGFKLKHQLSNRFYEAEYMRAISCILKLGLVTDSSFSSSTYIKDFFTNQKKIGAESVEGIAMVSGVKTANEIFIIKAPKNPKYDNLTHEYFVANGGDVKLKNGDRRHLIGTNMLRKQCLNYAQILAGFRCGPPSFDGISGRILNFCQTEGMDDAQYVNYLVYEKVPGPDMKKLVNSSSISTDLYISTIMQLAYALEIAQDQNGFTHYDLHHENIIMRPVDETNPNSGEMASIPFDVGGKTIYILSSHIATIIDMGRSHVQSPSPREEERTGVKASHFGYYSYFALEYGIMGDEARPFYDIFKILGFTLYELASKDSPVFEQVWPIMSFFGISTREQVLNWLKVSRGSDLFSITDKRDYCLLNDVTDEIACLPEEKVTMIDFLDFIFKMFQPTWDSTFSDRPHSGYKVFKCDTDCLSFKAGVQSSTNNEIIKASPEGSYSQSSTTSAIYEFDRTRLIGIINLMEYRENLNQRYLWFTLNQPKGSQDSKILSAQLASVDATIGEHEFNAMREGLNSYIQKLVALDNEVKMYESTKILVDKYVVYLETGVDPYPENGILEQLEHFSRQLRKISKVIDHLTRIWRNLDIYYTMKNLSKKEILTYMRDVVNPFFLQFDTSHDSVVQIVNSFPDLYPNTPKYKRFILAILGE
jgi:serine/threonine protein kinase